jgi:hypothetical protein
MEFKTLEDYLNYTHMRNNSYIDISPEVKETQYTKRDKHYIYPEYDIFEKEISNDNTTRLEYEFLTDLVISAILAQNDETPIEYLTIEQKLGICIGAGIPMKYENGKFVSLYDVKIVLIDKKYKIFYKMPDINRTYC